MKNYLASYAYSVDGADTLGFGETIIEVKKLTPATIAATREDLRNRLTWKSKVKMDDVIVTFISFTELEDDEDDRNDI